MTRNCSTCQALLGDDDRFCPECGAPMPLRARRRRWMALAAAAAAGVLVVGALVGLLTQGNRAVAEVSPTPQATSTLGGASPAEPTWSPSVTPGASPLHSATPEPLTPPPAALTVDSFARATVDELNLRERPSRVAPVVGQLFTGAQVMVLGGPSQAEGFTWYQVVIAGGPYTPRMCPDWGCADVMDIGWVACVSDARVAWLEAMELGCPRLTTDPGLLRSLTDLEILACYGSQRITLEATINTPCCAPPGPYEYEPAWLAAHAPMFLDGHGPGLHFPPDSSVPMPERGDVVRVTGHFDDPRASSCTARFSHWVLDESGQPEEDVEAPNQDEVRLHCRMVFVVDAIEVTGKEDLGPCC